MLARLTDEGQRNGMKIPYVKTKFDAFMRMSSLIRALPKDAIMTIHVPVPDGKWFTGIAIRNVRDFEFDAARHMFTFTCDGTRFTGVDNMKRCVTVVTANPVGWAEYKGTFVTGSDEAVEFKCPELRKLIGFDIESIGSWYSPDGTPFRCEDIPLWEKVRMDVGETDG